MQDRICLCVLASFSIERSGKPSARLRTSADSHWSMSGWRDVSAQTLPQEPYPIRSRGVEDCAMVISEVVCGESASMVISRFEGVGCKVGS